MCDDDHEHDHEHPPPRGVSRRSVLQGMVALAAFAGLGGRGLAAAATLPSRAQNLAGLNAYAMAMHLHASSSEGTGSVRSQLQQAVLNGFDVAWFNDHDWRRHRLLFRQSYSFTANESQFGGTWNVAKLANVGSLTTTSGGALVTPPPGLNDPRTPNGSLRLRATSTGSSAATVKFRINAEGSSRANFRGRIAGRNVVVEVLPNATTANAWGEVFLRLSHHPASGSRPSGVYTLLYRLKPGIGVRTRSTTGLAGFVDVPVTAGAWQTVTLNPVEDAAAIWPDVNAYDNSLNEIEFRATSRQRSAAEVFFGYLRFPEDATYQPLLVESAILAEYANTVPVLGLNGTEISLAQHLNQYGGEQAPYDYSKGQAITLRTDLGNLRSAIVEHIHAHNGLASLNHPFKAGDSGGQGAVASVASLLVETDAGGADIIEVGYANKHGGDIDEHLAVWDILSRNGLILTGNGVSDDHSGQNWLGQVNRFYTAAWAANRAEGDLLDALAKGRSYVGHLGSFGGTIDMSIDDTILMGSVVVGTPQNRTLRLDVSNLPPGAGVQIVRGDVDYGSSTVPSSSVLTTLNGNQLTTAVPVPAGDCFVRAQVVTSAGAVIGFGQPIWLLEQAPTTGVPNGRLVTPTP